ncbi:32346_t:CDS:2, partial [Gigaspora margarita]
MGFGGGNTGKGLPCHLEKYDVELLIKSCKWSWKGEGWEVRAIGIEYGAYSVELLRFTTFGYFDRSGA